MQAAVVEISDLRVMAANTRLNPPSRATGFLRGQASPPKPILDIPNLTFDEGERVAILGPNGAGKTSLLRVMGGFLPFSAGQMCVFGRQILPAKAMLSSATKPGGGLSAGEWRALRREIGQMMQALHLVPRLTALENTVLGALARPGAMTAWQSWTRSYPRAIRDEATAALVRLGMGERLHTRADRLSGGERQKTSLARLILQRPRLLLVDEPTAALDPGATRQACDELNRLAQRATMLTVVHDTALLPDVADRVLGLKAGRLVFDLPRADVTSEMIQALYR